MSTPPDFARCTVRHPDGRWLYHLPTAHLHGVTSVLAEYPNAPGDPVTGHPMTRIGTGNWWSADAEATRIVLLKQPSRRTTSYVLKDPQTESVRYPATLTVPEWEDRREDAFDSERELLWSLYSAVTEPQDPIEEPIDGPFVVLDGTEPPAPGGPGWTVNLVDAITQRPEYAHLFPGYISGLSTHVKKLIDRMPGVKYNLDGFQGVPGLHVTIQVPFAEPVTRWKADRSRRTDKPLKSGRHVPVLVDRCLILPVPNRVHGDNYASALAEWNAQIAYWTDQVKDASVAACNHCHGTGHIPAGAEQYDARR